MYIDDLLIISKGNWYDNLDKKKLTLHKMNKNEII